MTETQEQPKIDINTFLNQYVATETGTVFHVLQSKKNKNICYLRRKNKNIQTTLLAIKQNLVDGKYKAINEHQLKAFLKEDNAYIEQFSQKLTKRTILAQLLLELDDELIQDFAHDKRMKSVLTRSNKEVERVSCKMYDRVYNAEEKIAQQVMNEIDTMTTNIGKLDLSNLLVVGKIVKEYIRAPKEFVEHFNTKG